MNLSKWLVAAAAVTATGVAAAAPTLIDDWGSHDAGELSGVAIYSLSGPQAIDHVFAFSLDIESDILGVAVSNDAVPVFNISDGLVTLYASNGDADYENDTAVGSWNFDSTAISQTFSGVAAGDYFYRVTGTLDGTLGGSYLISSAVVPVPEPETYALMLAGLTAVGFIARRRKSS